MVALEHGLRRCWRNQSGFADIFCSDLKGTAGVGHYKCLDINITHPIRATQLAIAEFLKPSDGSPAASARSKRVVHIASIASQFAALGIPLYVASKHAIDGFVRSMESLDILGIRVNGVQPGIVRTPLWLDHPEKLGMRTDADIWTEPGEVAQAMLRCLEDPELVGGTMLEVGHEVTRVVPLFGNTGPSGDGHSVSAGAEKAKEVFEWLSRDGWGKSA